MTFSIEKTLRMLPQGLFYLDFVNGHCPKSRCYGARPAIIFWANLILIAYRQENGINLNFSIKCGFIRLSELKRGPARVSLDKLILTKILAPSKSPIIEGLRARIYQ